MCSGKGESPLEARVSALAEALERYCAEPRGRLEIVTAPAGELAGAVLDPVSLIVSPEIALGRPLDWCRGTRLDGSPVWVPVNAVIFPYQESPRATRLFAAHTHGLASGATRNEAIVHGLLECIERDCYARAIALASTGRGRLVPVIDPGDAEAIVGQIAIIRRAGFRILLRDLTADTAVPAVLCTISDGLLTHMGMAAHPDAAIALRKATIEAAQSRLTDLQGAREDLPARNTNAETDTDPWFTEAGDARIVSLPAASGSIGLKVEDVLAGIAARLAVITPPVEPAVVDLSLRGVDMAVVRVITPGLEVWAHDPSRIGPRARTWLSAA